MQRITKTVDREANPDLIAMRARTERAVETLRGIRVHNLKPARLMANWPNILRDYWESYGTVVHKNTPARPSPKAITDMENVALLIVAALNVVERGVIWDRAARLPWKIICQKLHCDRTAAWRMYTTAIMKMVAMEKGYSWKDGTQDVEELAPKVYAIQGETTKSIKIGWSFNPQKRVNDLQVAAPEKLKLLGSCYGAMTQERAIHAHLSPHRLSGEWFAPEPLVMQAVKRIISCDKAEQVLQHLEAWRRGQSAA
jgi:hypothetical protein